MGKPTGFLEFGRRVPEKLSVDDRLKHYREIYKSLSEDQLAEQASRCMDCGVPFCHGIGCPLGNVIPEWNEEVYHGNWKEANRKLHLTNNFPEITGRICPALCEAACTVGLNDSAVTIRQIELQIVEKAFAERWISAQSPEKETGFHIAVVGSGPAGLAAAQQLRRAGHAVDIFERSPLAGGLLRFGIPDYKLEKWVLDRRIRQMEEEGVVFNYEVDIGHDLSAKYLCRKFDVVCLAGGAGMPRGLPVPGHEAKGIYFAMEFLTQQNLRNAGRKIASPVVATGKDVVIIGGGDTSNDCLGTALRQGAKSVTQLEIMPQPPESRDERETPWPMWPKMLRTSTSHEEGGERCFSVTTDSFRVENDCVTGLNCREVSWEEDEKTGKMNFAPIEGSGFVQKADLVLLAMGFTSPEHDGLLDAMGLEYDSRGNVQINPETMMTSVENVFSAGDMATGAWLVVGAIAGGRRMARQVDLHLTGESNLPDCEPMGQLNV